MQHAARALVIAIALTLPGTPPIAGDATPASADATALVLDVYKGPNCHCCVDWMKHLEQNGIGTRAHHPDDFDALKARYGVSPQYESCHTAVSPGGYVFEGHVPAKFIRQFLASPPPHARGLAVPGMPLGSPGMESDDFFMPYKIYLLKDDGTVEVYASISKAAEQFDSRPGGQ
jgi:hypothetical protein